jgi:uncharacterized protein YicC (UPF0701 family)
MLNILLINAKESKDNIYAYKEEITKAILIPVAEAAANLEKMRAIEGEKLAEDLIAKGAHVKEILDQIAELQQ